MLPNDYEGQVCSVARALEVVGERWSLLIVRDVLIGLRRFDELKESLGINRSVLTARLSRLVDERVLERRRYQQRPERFEYHPTARALELFPVLAHLMWWGDRHYPAPEGPPRVLVHAGCGGELSAHFTCTRCGASLTPAEVDVLRGPGLLAHDRRSEGLPASLDEHYLGLGREQHTDEQVAQRGDANLGDHDSSVR